MSAHNNHLYRLQGKNRLIQALLISTALAGVGGVRAAWAEEDSAPISTNAHAIQLAQADTTPAGRGATAAPAANGGSVGLEQVVVTARRRAENLQTTPVSETAISGAGAAQLNVRDFQNLRGLVPNLEVTPQANGGAALTIRGIGQTNDQVNVDAKTGYYVNEMYVGRQEGNTLYFYDLDSLQVLKGPQGTLFARTLPAAPSS